MKVIYPILHPAGVAAEIAAIKARTRQVVAQSFELLRLAEPDTFLGRQHYASFSQPREATKRVSEDTDGVQDRSHLDVASWPIADEGRTTTQGA